MLGVSRVSKALWRRRADGNGALSSLPRKRSGAASASECCVGWFVPGKPVQNRPWPGELAPRFVLDV
jgi:hypothetical protein